MLYILAAIGAITVLVLLWRLLATQRLGDSTRGRRVAPDDDPEFLRELGEQQRRNDRDES